MKPRPVDVLVVGAGVVGVCSAWFLQQAGARVVLVDQGAVCSGSSHGNAGLIVPSHCVPLAEPAALAQGLRWLFRPDSPFYIKPRLDADLLRWLWRFRRAATAARVERAIPVLRDLHLASRTLYAEFAAAGVDFEYGERGRVLLCDTDQGLAAAVEEGHHMRNAGLEVEELDRAGIARHLGDLPVNCIGGVFYPQDAHLSPARFVHSLAQRARDAGVEIVESAQVLHIGSQERRATVVDTTRGAFQAEQLVLAAGSWSPELAANLGLHLPIQPAKGYSIEIAAPDDTPAVPFMLHEAKVGVTPLGQGRLRFAGTLELAGLDLTINRRRVDAIVQAVPRYVPGWDPAEFVVREIWRGLRPCTPDGLPALGRPHNWDNVVIAAGHAMIGMSLGPVTGRIVAQIVGGQTPDFDLDLLDPDRFG
ncbi:MAG TPA: FAD-dependent oxidoreductase [Candidatus Latescibacteria bacterium]|nr:FAD-dependent oxidoreductase [Candidatus Latescibacterota bacterium]